MEPRAELWEGLLPVRLLEPGGVVIGNGKLSCLTFCAKGGLSLARMYGIITRSVASPTVAMGKRARAEGGSYPNNRK